MDAREAETLARARLAELEAGSGLELVLLAGETQACRSGWVFFYNSADYVRTGNPSDMLAGNGPILVRTSGTVETLPTHSPWQEFVVM